MTIIFNPQHLARLRFCGSASAQFFGGGGGKSESHTSSSANQTYNTTDFVTNTTQNTQRDSGNTTSNWWQTNKDSHDVNNRISSNTALTDSGNTTANWTDSHAVANSGNTSDSGNTSANWWQANSDSHAVANSGNTSTALKDSGNTSTLTQWLSSLTTSNSGNTTNTDGRSFASTDSHTLTDSGNSSTVVNYTGLDGGAGLIAQTNAQLLGAMSDSNLKSLQSLVTLGANVGNKAADMAALSQSNSLTLSNHMLDLTGELIDRIATGAGTTAAAQTAMVQSTAGQAGKVSSDMRGMVFTVAGLVLAAIVLKKI